MVNWEYIVVPAPKKAPKVKGAKTGEARFAHTLTEIMNTYGAEGWEYLRSDTLPCEERSGFTGTKTVYQNLLVFRRSVEVAVGYDLPPADTTATPEQLAAELSLEQAPQPAPAPLTGAQRFVAAPQPGAAADTAPRLGSAARLGPAATGGRVAPFPFPAVERKD